MISLPSIPSIIQNHAPIRSWVGSAMIGWLCFLMPMFPKVFKTPEAVNNALQGLDSGHAALPRGSHRARS